MVQYEILKEDTKIVMNSMFKDKIFDYFEVRSIEIYSFTKFTIHCGKNPNFYAKDYEENNITKYLTWLDIKSHALNMIKGKQTPTHMKIVFSIPEEYLNKIHSNAKSLYINFNYENEKIILVTGCSQSDFQVNKDLDNTWDEYVKKFMDKNNITILKV
ncbi:MAG: DUF5721 family protein [Lachnospirales bacterium]